MTSALRAPGPTVWAAALALFVSGCEATQPSGGAVTETPAPALAPALAPATLDPDDLSGLARTELAALLGEADFDRRDGPAEMLQYRNGNCILDVFLYRESANEAFRVAHVEARNLKMQSVPGEDCLRSLRETRQNSAG